VIGRQTLEKRGIQWLVETPDLKGATFSIVPFDKSRNRFLQRKLGRPVVSPDILFSADILPATIDGTPNVWSFDSHAFMTNANFRTSNNLMVMPHHHAVTEQGWFSEQNLHRAPGNVFFSNGKSPEVFGSARPDGDGVRPGGSIPLEPYVQNPNPVTNPGQPPFIAAVVGPGHFSFPAGGDSSAPFQYRMRFHKLHEDFEMIWSGESSVVGTLEEMPSLWGYIKGPGPEDFVTFPQQGTQAWLENAVLPRTDPPTMGEVSDRGEGGPIERNTLTRTEETLTLTGEGMASVTRVDILSGNVVVQSIAPVDGYVVSARRLDLPPGVVGVEAEGTERRVRLWNSVGASALSTEVFNIETGRPVVTATSRDGMVVDREQDVLELRGYGFRSVVSGEQELGWVRLDASEGQAVYDNGVANGGVSDGLPLAVGGLRVLSDTMAVVPMGTLDWRVDGLNRRLRVARRTVGSAADVGSVLSPATNPLFAAVTAKPVVNTLSQLDGDWEDVGTSGMFKRDRALEVNGTGLNTARTLEVVLENGASFPNPVFIQLPNAGVHVEENGTRILVGANAIPYADADSNGTVRRALRVYNAVGHTELNASLTFAVNVQPEVAAIGGFAVAGHWNRDTVLGEDLVIHGTGLGSVGRVVLADADDTGVERLRIELPSPGVTVSDTRVVVERSLMTGLADTDVNASRRVVKLQGARTEATSPLAQGFGVGVPPRITGLGGVSVGHYRRDTGVLTITGAGLGEVRTLELVDGRGNPMAGVVGLVSGVDGTGGTGLSIHSQMALEVAANATGWREGGHLLDTPTAGARRIRVTTPFGVATSALGDGFTVSATPLLGAGPQGTFAGGGYDGGTNRYDRSAGSLVINGNNFRGLRRIGFYSSTAGDGNVTLDPANPPAGFAFNTAGTQLVINGNALPPEWIGKPNAWISLQSAAGTETNSTIITTQE